MEILFWTSFAIILYTYIGYGLILWIHALIFPSENAKIKGYSLQVLPLVSHIICAYNEENCIQQKIENTLKLNYPSDRIEHVIITDGSNDSTVDIVKGNAAIKHFHQEKREGKLAAINRVLPETSHEIIVFSDANTMLNVNAIIHMIVHFQSPNVGVVAGEKVVFNQDRDAVSSGESLYWRIESYIKKLEDNFHSVIGAAGELYAIRRSLYSSPPGHILTEDFVTTMQVAEQGYRIAYEPTAIATEQPSYSIAEEYKRKVRISTGGLQSLFHLRSLLNPFRHRRLTFQYISHKVLRWAIVPACLIILLVSTYFQARDYWGWFQVFFIFQLICYLLALIGFFLEQKKWKSSLFNIPFYFLFMNVVFFAAWYHFIKGDLSPIWLKSKRK